MRNAIVAAAFLGSGALAMFFALPVSEIAAGCASAGPPKGVPAVRWEYTTTSAWGQPSMEDARKAVQEYVDDSGNDGWEMVGFAVNPESTTGHLHGAGGPTETAYDRWNLVIYFKRPIAP
ncbi:MAG: hypothetical protein ACRDTV_12175 [Mycobacterium sp.]